jgi:ABC-type phosphate/phosphonate transport system substrate-binding protein
MTNDSKERLLKVSTFREHKGKRTTQRQVVLWLICSVFACWSFLLMAGLAVAASSDQSKRADLVVSFSPRTMIDVDIKDAISAFRIYVDELAGQMNHTGSVLLYDTLDGAMKDVENNKVDLVSMTSIEYLRLKHKAFIEPAFAYMRGGKTTQTYHLLIHANKGYSSLSDLKGKKLVIVKMDATSLLFLNTALLKQRLPEMKDLFSVVEEKSKPAQAVLSVFFGQSDACLINDVTFQTMKDMNPQLGKNLEILATSPELLDNLTVFRKNMESTMKQKVFDVSRRLKTTARGKQILALFKVDDLVPMKEIDLVGIRELLNEYDRLKAGR